MPPIRPPNGTALFRTSTFRIAVLYLVLFAVSALALLGFVYATTAGFMSRQTDETIQAEITGLAEQYRRWGLVGLTRVVIERSRNQRHSLYLLAEQSGNPLAGNLDAWPDVTPNEEGWVNFTYERPMGGETEDRAARARTFRLRGGLQLLVGRDVAERHELDSLLRASLAWAGGITICLGLLGGILMSRNALRRIEAINRASRDIMAGDLSRRVPLSGSGDELDRLAENLNAMLAQIEELMTAMREVTDNIAHDLRSPLSRLRSRLEVTLMEPPSVEAYGDALRSTIEDAEQLLATFNALLDIARAEAGAERQAMTRLDLALLVHDVADLYGPVAEDDGKRLVVAADGPVEVRGNRHLLSQALANLIDNAVKYSPTGGIVSIAVHATDGGAELIVTDTGPGIPAAERERVFDRFVRLEASRHTPGSGLGLSLVRAVVRLHRATMTLEDAAPGLRVRVVFPDEG